MAEKTSDDFARICPYCESMYKPDSADYSEDERIEECNVCGKKYRAYDSFSVTHYATPDCELNDGQHEWDQTRIGEFKFCLKCDKCRHYQK